MKIIVDNKIANLLADNPASLDKKLHAGDHISFQWPSLLEYLGFGSLLTELPPFNQNNPLFIASIGTLCTNEEKEVIFYIYDRLFAENLNHIKGLPQIEASVLLQAIREKRGSPKHLSTTLSTYETALLTNPVHTMHDLTLYLAWDRICVWMGQLFNHPSADPNFIRATRVLRECLIESYHHITSQGKTAPSFYRMMEALLLYHMREENIETHTDEEWALLSQSLTVLKDQNSLADSFYIDNAITAKADAGGAENAPAYLTIDPIDKVNLRLALAHYMTAKLKGEIASWEYALQSKKIHVF